MYAEEVMSNPLLAKGLDPQIVRRLAEYQALQAPVLGDFIKRRDLAKITKFHSFDKVLHYLVIRLY